MNIGGLNIEHEPGQTYDQEVLKADGTAEDEDLKRDRAERRQQAIDDFKKQAQATTIQNLERAVEAVLGLAIQLRAVGGSAAGSGLDVKLREAADFIRDI